ncbi:hypothetical protein DFH27DRAFT_16161 [Peziza echinospora]|nr:hypothetical protein DFH27DRAFT_16161 [Peziza echinospora]
MLAALRTALLKRGVTVAARSGRTARRGYATAGPELHGKQSELPWIIGSVGFTVPAVVYLLSGTGEPSHDAHAPTVKDTAHDITDAVKSAIPSTESVKAAVTSAVPASVSDKATKAAEVVSDKASKATAVVSDKTSQATDVVSDKTAKASDVVSDKSEKAADVVSDKSEKAADVVSDKASQASDAVSEKASKASDVASDTAAKAAKAAEDTASETSESVKEAVAPAKKSVEGAATAAKDAVAPAAPEGTTSLPGKAKQAAKDVKEKLTSKGLPEYKGISTEKPTYGAAGGINDKDAAPGDVVSSHVGTAATDRDPRSFNEMSGKQEGLSNGPTFHASLHSTRGKEISMKAEGVHDTTKLKGSVDPKREGS